MNIKLLINIINVFQVILLSVFASIIYYIYQLEQMNNPPCTCSDNWRRHYIKWYFVFAFVYSIASRIFKFKVPPILNIIILLSALVEIYSLFTYVRLLKSETECKCATELELYQVARYYSYIQVGMMGISLLVVLLIGIMYFFKK